MNSLKIKIDNSIRKLHNWMVQNQSPEGTWPEPYVGPLFLLPLYIFALKICDKPLSVESKTKMANYIFKYQLSDGSFGLHQESKEGTLFTSIINYIALRFIDHLPAEPSLQKTLNWIHQHGGPLYAANWCKFILAFLNLYSYKGISPLPPEFYLLPAWFPFHPRKIGGFTRIIYLPMCYFYRKGYAIETSKLIHELRNELYAQPYNSIDFGKHINTFSKTDNLLPETAVFRLTMSSVKKTERFIPYKLKNKALELVYKHIQYEDENSNYIRQAPINAIYNTLVHYFRGDDEKLDKSWQTLTEYIWEDNSELMMQGYTNTNTWDVAFYLQAIETDANYIGNKAIIEKARNFLLNNQVLNKLEDPYKFHRIQNTGGWGFSDGLNGWVVSDCTAESILALLKTEYDNCEIISDKQLQMGMNFLISIQNKDGGWSSIDKAIGNKRLEWFNASNLFIDIMVDHSFIECTSSVIQALMKIKQKRQHLFTKNAEKALIKAIKYIIKNQRKDGSWEGVWGLCMTYGTCFAIKGLKSYGIKPEDPLIQRACDFLWSKQKEDGGWGEAQESALKRKYIQADRSIVDQTAWAILVLLNGGYAKDTRLVKAINWMIDQQLENGDWPVQPITGLFYKTVMISYRNYKRYFPLMALKKYKEEIG